MLYKSLIQRAGVFRDRSTPVRKFHTRDDMGEAIQGSLGVASSFQIMEEMEVSRGRTNSEIETSTTEFAELNEKTSNFDIRCKAKNPMLSRPDMQVNLHVDIEPQKNYRPGYPIEKRGFYYLARALSAQLNL